MALVLKKSITVDGASMINDEVVVTAIATVSSEGAGTSYINQTVINQELYTANKVQVRKDLQEFQNAVYEVEDTIQAEFDTKKNMVTKEE